MTRLHYLALLTCALPLLFIGTAAADLGGFELRVDQPGSDAAVLVVRAFGCHQPEEAKIIGMAEGLIDGARQSVPLTLRATAKGVYDVVWDRPAEGAWVLALTGTYRGYVSSLLVEINDQGRAELPKPDRYGRRIEPVQRSLTKADVEQALEEHSLSE